MLRIATRQSALALQQTSWVKDQLQKANPNLQVKLIPLTTEGDQRLDTSLNKIGGKGLFTKALEDALLNNEADIAVHSMKDVPNHLPEGLSIGAICLREAPYDVLLTQGTFQTLEEIPQNATVGTSSLRRQSQILALRPDLQIKLLRGNIDTRLRKLQEGLFDAIILAQAGLNRLNYTTQRYILPLDKFIPCAGQGAVGIEYRTHDLNTLKKISPLNHPETEQCVLAERTLSRELGGNCQVPIGAYASIHHQTLTLLGFVGSTDGTRLIKTQQSGDLSNPIKIGMKAAQDLILQGGQEILNTTLT